jgi:hypothetical protein
MRRLLIASLFLLCSQAVIVHAGEPDRRIAVTIDDLPWQRMATTSPEALRTRHAALLEQLRHGRRAGDRFRQRGQA